MLMRNDIAFIEAAYAAMRLEARRTTKQYVHNKTVLLPPADDGLAGARLAIDDNNTTGRFMNQQFALMDLPVELN